MGKRIDWFNGKNSLNDYDMQEICDQIADADTPQNLAEVIKGSEQIVVDVSEDNKSLEIRLDASAGGSKLYQHTIQFIEGNIILITNSNEIFTTETLKQYFISLGIGDSFSNRYRIKNIINIDELSAKISIYNSIYIDGTRLCFRGVRYAPTITEGVLTYTVTALSPSVNVQGDTVIEL